jgi:hypothetical protein
MWMYRLRRGAGLLAGALALCLSGCQTMHDPSQSRQVSPVYLTDTTAVQLLPPSASGGAFESYQQIEGSYRGQTYYLEAFVQSSGERFIMVAFNSFGTKVFEVEHTAGGVRFSASVSPGNMKPEYILADYQLCFFPFEAVRRNLAGAGLTFQEKKDGDVLVRTVSAEGRTIIEIRRTAREVRYVNLLRGYRYIVREK